jgi:transposase InsO family protein
MRTFVKNYVKGCAFCQQFKINRHPTKPALMPIPGPTSTRPFAQLSMDFITDLPPTKGYDSTFSVVHHGLTKGIILVPCTKLGATADATATMMLDHVFKRFSLPDKVITNRGPQFTSRMFRELMKHLGVQTSLSTAYHPQTDGTTERFNQEIEAYLSIYCTSHPEDWVDALPVLEFTSVWKSGPVWFFVHQRT